MQHDIGAVAMRDEHGKRIGVTPRDRAAAPRAAPPTHGSGRAANSVRSALNVLTHDRTAIGNVTTVTSENRYERIANLRVLCY